MTGEEWNPYTKCFVLLLNSVLLLTANKKNPQSYQQAIKCVGERKMGRGFEMKNKSHFSRAEKGRNLKWYNVLSTLSVHLKGVPLMLLTPNKTTVTEDVPSQLPDSFIKQR